MRETDLFHLVKPFLEWKAPNARIYTELDDRDIVLFEDLVIDDKTYISEFELKLSLNKELLKQLCNRDKYKKGHYLYAVVPIQKYNQEFDILHLFRKMGWGLITVNTVLAKQFPDYPMRYCEIEVKPILQAPYKVHKEPQESVLFKDLQAQAGGSVRTLKFTGFKADLENIYFSLKDLNRPRSVKAIQALLLANEIKMEIPKIRHRLRCLSEWNIIIVTKRGRTSLNKCICNNDIEVYNRIIKGSKNRVH